MDETLQAARAELARGITYTTIKDDEDGNFVLAFLGTEVASGENADDAREALLEAVLK